MAPGCLRTLLCLVEVTREVGEEEEEGEGVRRGRRGVGMEEMVRNRLFPSADEVSAFSLQFGSLPEEEEEGKGSQSSIPPCIYIYTSTPFSHFHTSYFHSHT